MDGMRCLLGGSVTRTNEPSLCWTACAPRAIVDCNRTKWRRQLHGGGDRCFPHSQPRGLRSPLREVCVVSRGTLDLTLFCSSAQQRERNGGSIAIWTAMIVSEAQHAAKAQVPCSGFHPASSGLGWAPWLRVARPHE